MKTTLALQGETIYQWALIHRVVHGNGNVDLPTTVIYRTVILLPLLTNWYSSTRTVSMLTVGVNTVFTVAICVEDREMRDIPSLSLWLKSMDE